MQSIQITTIETLLQDFEPHPTVQRSLNPAHVKKLVASFTAWLAEDRELNLPMFFAVTETSKDSDKYLVYDGQHRLAALKAIEEAGIYNIYDTKVAVSVTDEPAESVLKQHFNAINSGKLVSTNLQASFCPVWADIESHFVQWQLDLIEKQTAGKSGALFDASNIKKLYSVWGSQGMTLVSDLMNALPDGMRRRTPAHRECAYFSSHFITALCELPKFLTPQYAVDAIEIINKHFLTCDLKRYQSDVLFSHFWVDGKAGRQVASSAPARKSWLAHLLEILAVGNFNHMSIPKSLVAVVEYAEDERLLLDYVNYDEPSKPSAEEKAAAKAKEKEEKAKVAAEAKALKAAAKVAAKAAAKAEETITPAKVSNSPKAKAAAAKKKAAIEAENANLVVNSTSAASHSAQTMGDEEVTQLDEQSIVI
jgi:hypothetical protein